MNKRYLSAILVLVVVISMLCSTTLSVGATLAPTNGLGIIDDTTYYIYVGEGSYLTSKYFLTPELNLHNSSVITQNNVQTFSSRYIWKVDKQTDGTFRIKSYGGSGYYLSTISGSNITINSSEHDDFVNFEICRIDDQIYNQYFSESGREFLKGKYFIKNDIYFLTMGASGVELKVTPTEFSCWSFVAVDKGFGDNYGYVFDDPEIADQVEDAYIDMGYYYLPPDDPDNPAYILDMMMYNDITIISGEGEAGAVIIDPSSIDSMGKISADYRLSGYDIQAYVSDLPANSLATSRCIIYLSSYSGDDALGEDGEYYNLVDETYKKGAHFVLGFSGNLSDDTLASWLSTFIDNIEWKTTINSAIDAANRATETNNTYARGDGTQHLNF